MSEARAGAVREADAAGCVGDSADPAVQAWVASHPDSVEVIQRCAGRKGEHSVWAYGPVYIDGHHARTASPSGRIVCRCGRLEAWDEAYPGDRDAVRAAAAALFFGENRA